MSASLSMLSLCIKFYLEKNLQLEYLELSDAENAN